MWPRGLFAVLAASACGRVDFEIRSDAAGDAPDCALGPWSASRRVDELLRGGSSLGTSISPDGLAMYFGSDGPGTQGLDPFVATRASRSDPFSSPVRLDALASPTYDHNPTIAGDGRELWFASDRTGSRCLYRTIRVDTNAAFPAPSVVPEFCGAIDYDGAYLTPDALALLYTSNGGANRTYVTTRAVRTDPFPPGRELTEIVFPTGWGFGVLSNDQRTIYFEVYDNPDDVAIWEATRPSITDPFGTPAHAGLDRIGEDVSITGDGRELYFSSGPVGGIREIFVSTRACL